LGVRADESKGGEQAANLTNHRERLRRAACCEDKFSVRVASLSPRRGGTTREDAYRKRNGAVGTRRELMKNTIRRRPDGFGGVATAPRIGLEWSEKDWKTRKKLQKGLKVPKRVQSGPLRWGQSES